MVSVQNHKTQVFFRNLTFIKTTNLRRSDLLPGQLVIARQLGDGEIVGGQPPAEVADHLLYERAHRGYVDDLEVVDVDRAVRVDVLADLPHHAEQGDVGLTGARRSAQQEILVLVEGAPLQPALDAIEALEALERRLGEFRQVAHRDQLLVLVEGLRLQGWHVDLFVAGIETSWQS